MEITLTELLDAREERVRMQLQLQKEHSCPLVCFTMNIAGPVKTSPLIVRGFKYGLEQLEKKLANYTILSRHIEYSKSGPTAFLSVLADAKTIKDICIQIEESCPLGRLFDMDVLDTNGVKLERHFQRCCIICGKEGRGCAAGRIHSVEQLQGRTKQILTEHFIETDSAFIGMIAKNSLIDEVNTTPKPGLVDGNNTGSHTDMNIDSFFKSANILYDYFKHCVTTGIQTSSQNRDTTFFRLRAAGLEAEKNMYSATNGVNTHKGIIYSMGVICGAIGRLWTPEAPTVSTACILEESAALVKKSSKEDLANVNSTTAGGRAYLSNGEKGIRGEVSSGFPSVRNISLPAYKHALSEGKNKNDAGVIALLHLIANIFDTSIYNRGGEEGVLYARQYAKNLLSQSQLNTEQIQQMDNEFINRNLSPGGSADLLAITYFLTELENQNNNNSINQPPR